MPQTTIHYLRPSLQQKIWGGERLKGLKNSQLAKLGESWEVSIHPDGQSVLEDGRRLGEVVSENEIPYLVKFIDTSDVLSVQVHPDNEYAARVENTKGKMECWLILDAGADAELFLGFNEGVNLEEFKQASLDKKDLTPYLKKYNPKPFDFFFVPPGTIHAIGKDVFLLEVQQSSGITYRVWDWNRVDENGKSRELHPTKAFEVLKLETPQTYIPANEILDIQSSLLVTDDFSFRLVRGECSLQFGQASRYKSLINLSPSKCSFSINGEERELEAYSSLTGVWNSFESSDKELCIALVE
jgi:mannose-6-phosphate isomerase